MTKELMSAEELVWLGWLAGVIDGEGCINIYRNRRNFRPRVSVSNSKIGLLRKVKDITGVGKIRESNKGTKRRRPCFQWTVESAEDVEKVLRKVKPFLVLKREQAELVLEFCDTILEKYVPPDHTELRGELAAKVRVLNKRGAR